MSKALGKKATAVKGVLLAALKPQIAADKMPDFDKVLAGVTRKNWFDRKGAIVAAIKPSLAADADIEDLVQLLNSLDDGEVDAAEDADDPAEEVLAMLRGKISDEDLAAIEEKIRAMKPAAAEVAAADEPPEFEGKPEVGAGPAEVKKAMDSAVNAAVARVNGIHEARKAVFPYVGELSLACDSAADVYRAALTNLGVSVKGVHDSAFPAILAAQPKPGEVRAVKIAKDSASGDPAYAEFKKSNNLA